jgi:hypothetical protein
VSTAAALAVLALSVPIGAAMVGVAFYFGLPFLCLQAPRDFWAGAPRPQFFGRNDGARAQGPPKP